MQLVVQVVKSQPVTVPALRDAARRRILFVLASYTPRIERVEARLQVPPAANGQPAHCRLLLRLAAGEQVVLEDQAPVPLEALTQVANRGARWVRRQLIREYLVGRSLGERTAARRPPARR